MAHKFRKKHSIITSVLLLIIAGCYFLYSNYINPSKPNEATLVKCIDGDTATFKLNNQDLKVRFLAINAPEIAHENNEAEPYGVEAQNYTCDMLKKAKKIRLEFEKSKTDKYGRNLAWVFVDEKLLNEEIVKVGLAKVAYLYDKYKYTPQVKQAEKTAKKNKVNLWK